MNTNIHPEGAAIYRAIAAAKSESDYFAILEDINRESVRLPSDAWLTEMRGTVSFHVGRFTEAIADFSVAEALYLEQYQQIGREFGADEYLNYLRLMLGRAYRNRGLTSRSRSDILQALASFEGAAAANEQSAVTWYYVSDALWRLGRRTDAIMAARRSAELDPDNPRIWSDLFHYHLRMFQFRSACGAYSKARNILLPTLRQ